MITVTLSGGPYDGSLMAMVHFPDCLRFVEMMDTGEIRWHVYQFVYARHDRVVVAVYEDPNPAMVRGISDAPLKAEVVDTGMRFMGRRVFIEGGLRPNSDQIVMRNFTRLMKSIEDRILGLVQDEGGSTK